jgi:hypothetical protein
MRINRKLYSISIYCICICISSTVSDQCEYVQMKVQQVIDFSSFSYGITAQIGSWPPLLRLLNHT